jgi:hypothetical protein
MPTPSNAMAVYTDSDRKLLEEFEDGVVTLSPIWQEIRNKEAYNYYNNTEDNEVSPPDPPPITAREFFKSSFHYPEDDGSYELPGYDPVEYLAAPESRMTEREVEDDKLGDVSVNLLEAQFHDFDGIQPVEKPSYIRDDIEILDYQLQGVAEGLARLKKHSE